MKTLRLIAMTLFYVIPLSWISAESISLATAPPVVVKTEPVAGATNVDPRTSEIVVQFSKPMMDRSWSWSTWGEENFPEIVGDIKYLADHRTCILPVKLEPGRFYATWLNSEKFKNFKDEEGRPAVPYLLTFTTGQSVESDRSDGGPNADQQAVIAWTDRQFRSYFDNRTFDGWSVEELGALEMKSLDALSGPRSREYYTAINTLGAMRSTNALPRLREIAFERVDGNNRNRWMCVRVLGIMGDRQSIPDLIRLVYHGNQNTRWWAQIALVQLTGENFGRDWEAWGTWWNESGGQPPYNPEIIRWWNGQADTIEELKQVLATGDEEFINDIKPDQRSGIGAGGPPLTGSLVGPSSRRGIARNGCSSVLFQPVGTIFQFQAPVCAYGLTEQVEGAVRSSSSSNWSGRSPWKFTPRAILVEPPCLADAGIAQGLRLSYSR